MEFFLCSRSIAKKFYICIFAAFRRNDNRDIDINLRECIFTISWWTKTNCQSKKFTSTSRKSLSHSFIDWFCSKVYEPMLAVNNNNNRNGLENPREQILERRITVLRDRIHYLEKKLLSVQSSERSKSPFLVLPVTYTPEPERSTTLEIVSRSPQNDSNSHLLLVEQTTNPRVFETIV